MTLTTYDPSSPMREARATYFAINGFGEDGGYGDAWVDFKLGPLPAPFPNTKGRLEAVRFHDLHHIVTGYDTNLTGEFEISAWELGAGCKDQVAAWALNLAGLAGGLFLAPRRTFRAFVRGVHSRSLYGLELEQLLDRDVAEVRRETRVDEAQGAAADGKATAAFVAAAAAGLVVGGLFLALGAILVPIGLVLGVVRKHGAAPAREGAASAPGGRPASTQT